MKRNFICLIITLFTCIGIHAVTTTYTFINSAWGSRIGLATLDGKTDGWVSNKNASDGYNAGYTDAQGRLYSCGVGVKTSTTGAGATSVLTFSNVTKITVNYCQNSSKGRGAINIRVGAGNPQTLTVNKPTESGQGVYNRDYSFYFDNETGPVTFSVDCSENGIYINTISITADNGSNHNPDVGEDVMWVVTDPDELQSGDLVMFGVCNDEASLVMGYYDIDVSRNNIRTAKGTFTKDRLMLRRIGDEYEYDVVRVGENVAFSDAWGRFLVANGGNPNKGNNNYLTVGDDYNSSSYGTFGLWHVSVDTDTYAATVKNTGVSRSNTIMYNPNKTAGTDIFACYADTAKYTLPTIYKLHGHNATAVRTVTVPTFDAAGYTLQGTRVDRNFKGIVIRNGKKFLQR